MSMNRNWLLAGIITVLAMFSSGTSSADMAPSNQARQQQVMCLADNIYFEARGESMLGQYAVGIVTINRLKDDRFPKSICEVVHQPGQFSWWHPSRNPPVVYDQYAFAESFKTANYLYTNYYESDNFPDILNGATYFHATHVHPGWKNVKVVAKIDDHVFYKSNL